MLKPLAMCCPNSTNNNCFCESVQSRVDITTFGLKSAACESGFSVFIYKYQWLSTGELQYKFGRALVLNFDC